MMEISVVIPTYNRPMQLKRLLDSLDKSTMKADIIVVDNPNLSLAEKRNWGYSQTKSDYILFIDDDNEIMDFTIKSLYSAMQKDNKIGIAGLIAIKDNKIVDGGGIRGLVSGFSFGVYLNRNIFDLWRKPFDYYEVDEVANAFMARRKVFRKIGWFDEKRFPIDLDEGDFCLRAKRAGYKVVCVVEALTKHGPFSQIPSFRRKKNAYCMGRNRILFQRKHLSKIQYGVYLMAFFPMFIFFYLLSLTLRRQFSFIPVFLEGVKDGLYDKLDGGKGY